MTLTVSATLTGTAPPAVLVDVASAPSVTAEVKVWRVHPDGSRWRVLSTSRVLIGSWSGIDYHPPFNVPFRYVAEAAGQVSPASPELFVPSDVLWLVHASTPALSRPVRVVVAMGARKKPARRARYAVLPASQDEEPLPVVRSDSRRGPESGDLTILAFDAQECEAFEQLLARTPVLLNSHRSDIVRWQWIDPGDLTIAAPDDFYGVAYRQLSFSWEACRAPSSDVAPLRTFGDIRAMGSFGDVAAAYANFRDMKLGSES